jgi:hypothetical protein
VSFRATVGVVESQIQRLGPRDHADAIMDRIIRNTVGVETDTHNVKEQLALTSA